MRVLLHTGVWIRVDVRHFVEGPAGFDYVFRFSHPILMGGKEQRVASAIGIMFNLGRKPKIGISRLFEPFIGTLHIALGRRLLGPPSDWPAPGRTYFSVRINGSKGLGYPCFWLVPFNIYPL